MDERLSVVWKKLSFKFTRAYDHATYAMPFSSQFVLKASDF